MVGNKLRGAVGEHFLELLLILGGIENFAENVKADVLLDAALCLGVKVNVAADVYHTVRDNLNGLALGVLYISYVYAGVLYLESLLL